MNFGFILLYVFLGLLALPLFLLALVFVSSRFVDPNKEYHKVSPYYVFLSRMTDVIVIWFMRVRIRVHQQAEWPSEPFLLVSNHASGFDPVVTWYVLRKRQIAFLSKKENFHAPVYGRILMRCGFLPIDRTDPRKAIASIQRAAEMMKSEGLSYCVYPEGTRNYGRELLSFHDGVFRIAQKAEAPIVVMTIKGSETIADKFPWHRSTVDVFVSAVIPREDVLRMRTRDLSEMAREVILRDSATVVDKNGKIQE